MAVNFEGRRTATVFAVRNVCLEVEKGQTHCVVGESGCGKSVSSFAVMNLIEKPGKIVGGEIFFDGRDLLKTSEAQFRKIRGKEISMIFQDPMNSLNPVYRCGDQIAETLVNHTLISKKDALKEAARMLDLVKIASPQKVLAQYPHELSGGLRQRVMIAAAIICKPKLLIADEPTTALDVTVQKGILNLLGDLQKEMGMAMLFITHDLGVVRQIADKISVLYAGEVVESAAASEIFASPKHPYTVGLLNAIPKLGKKSEKLTPIFGNLPDPTKEIVGCAFEPRCPQKSEICKNPQTPPFEKNGRFVRCVLKNEIFSAPSVRE